MAYSKLGCDQLERRSLSRGSDKFYSFSLSSWWHGCSSVHPGRSKTFGPKWRKCQQLIISISGNAGRAPVIIINHRNTVNRGRPPSPTVCSKKDWSLNTSCKAEKPGRGALAALSTSPRVCFLIADNSGEMICLSYLRWTRPSRLYTNFSRTISRTIMANQSGDRTNLVPFSSRLKEGRALALDVWTVFKQAINPCNVYFELILSDVAPLICLQIA